MKFLRGHCFNQSGYDRKKDLNQNFELSVTMAVRLAIMTESGKLVGSLWFNVSFFDAEKIVFRKKEFDKLYKRDNSKF